MCSGERSSNKAICRHAIPVNRTEDRLLPGRNAETRVITSSDVAAARLAQRPFPWASWTSFFERDFVARLVATFPRAGFEDVVLKGVRYRARALISDGVIAQRHATSKSWNALNQYFLSPGYRTFISDTLGVDLAACRVSAAVCTYGKESRSSPHTDRSHRVATQLIFLNTVWLPEWGGRLLLLNSDRIDDVAVSIIPAYNCSVLFRRSADSWHAVEAISSAAAAERRSILLHFSTRSVFV
jgi:2OG-Fe(II) oxygenase superfamily